jgi:hypothetical protein
VHALAGFFHELETRFLKKEKNIMPDLAVSNRHAIIPAPAAPTAALVPQYSAGSVVRTTIAKAQQAEHLISAALGELDTTYTKVQAQVAKPGRSYHQQRWFSSKAGYYFGTYEVAVKILVDRGLDDILHTSPWQPAPPDYPPLYTEAPRQSILKRLIGW